MTDLDLGLAENMTDDEIEALARDPRAWLTAKTILERETQDRKVAEARRVSIETRPDSPGALAVSIGHVQMPHLAMLDDLHMRARVGEVVRACVSLPARHGKPVSVDALVLMGDGSRRRLGDVVEGDMVIAKDGRPHRVEAVHVQGPLPSLTISTHSGRTVQAAYDHPFLTTEGWLRADELRPGSVLALLPRARTSPRADLTPEAARLLGYFVGDGSTGRTSDGFAATVTCYDDDLVKDLNRCADVLGFTVRGSNQKGEYLFSGGVRAWLREYGVAGHTSWTKRVPDAIFECAPEIIAEFLGAYFDCDGTVSMRTSRGRGGQETETYVEFYSVNRALLADVQHLLLRLGVAMRLRVKHGRYRGERHTSWRLSATSRDAVGRFAERVPLRGPKAARLRYGPVHPRLFEASFLPDEVVEVSDAGLVECRCLTVADEMSFLVEDLVVHNTDRLLKVGSAWRLDEDPDCRIMQISGSKSLVEQSSRWVRDELERPGAGYRVRPRTDVRAVSDWQIEGHQGGIFVGSMSSRIIGRGANLLEVDDLIGSAKEAESPVYREAAWRFLQGAFGRLEPGASVIIVNSRWHADDPIGRLLKEQPGRWEYLKIPAIAETHGPDLESDGLCLCGDIWDGHDDLLGRAPGVPLWPDRYDLDALESRRLEMGTFLFSAQMQQRPLKRTGGLWREEWITDRRTPAMTVEEMIERLRIRTVAVDPSASDDDGGDEAGIICGGKDRATGDAVITADLSGIYTPEGWARTTLVAAVELEADVVYENNLTPVFMRRSFKAAWEGLSREADAADDDGFEAGTVACALGSGRIILPRLMPATKPVKAKVGKELRASPVAQRYEQRKVVHAGVFPLLEDQYLTWRPQVDKNSPDRLDAAVHLITHLGDTGAPATANASEGGVTVPTGTRGAMAPRGPLAGASVAMGRRGGHGYGL